MYRIYEVTIVVAVPDYECAEHPKATGIDAVGVEWEDAFMLDINEREMTIIPREGNNQ